MDRKYRASKHIGDGAWPNGMNDYFPEDWVFPAVKIDFEGHSFSVPKEYDRVLTQFFGDYMTLPPEEKRQTHYIKAWR